MNYMIASIYANVHGRSITKIGRSLLHDMCYIVQQFQGQRLRLQTHIVLSESSLSLLNSGNKVLYLCH